MPFGYSSVTPKEHRERKPFQAFRRSNDLRKKKVLKPNVENQVGNPWGDTNKTNCLNRMAGILILTLALAAAYFVWKWYAKLPAYEANKAAVMQRTQSFNAKKDYDFLVKSAGEYMYSGNLVQAKSDFEGALKIQPNGREAAYGMALVLSEYCKTNNLFCKEAEQWQHYLEKVQPTK